VEKVALVKDTNSVRFADERQPVKTFEQAPWKILIVDDEDEIHAITRIVFSNCCLEGRSLQFLSAYSGTESKQLLREHADIALVLLDVVMEEETSGLEVARFIRKDLGNTFARIVLRTGQPGQAPERDVMIAYDINDYKEKTELTVPKLFTTVLGSLRAYRDLKAIEQNRQGLERIVSASLALFEPQSLENFVNTTLRQLGLLLQPASSPSAASPSGFIASWESDTPHFLAGSGEFVNFSSQSIIPEQSLALIKQARREKHCIFRDRLYVDYFHSRNGVENTIFLQHTTPLNNIEQNLLRIFSNNIAIAFDNVYLNQAIITTQKEVIFTLGQVIATRSQETENHVKRVSAFSHTLALLLGLSNQEAELLRLASPMHDIGKLGVPDAILNKCPPLSDEDYAVLTTHPRIGYQILKNSTQEILKTAAIIALQHHEHWDGSGYPLGLKGEAIPLVGRITAVADVFDALTSKRPYKEPWTIEKAVEEIKLGSGTHFEPKLVELFIENLPDVLEIKERFSDEP
jgi:response regulator RpfG family c-di-GMP phosphodiesterase